MSNFKKIIGLSVVFGLLVICIAQYLQVRKMKDEVKSINASLRSVPFDSLERKIVVAGDTNCYERLKMEYMDMDAIECLLPWALIMANKYNYKQANFDVYFAIQGIDDYYGKAYPEPSLNVVDTASRKIALEYLVRASKFQDSQAIEILKEYKLSSSSN